MFVSGSYIRSESAWYLNPGSVIVYTKDDGAGVVGTVVKTDSDVEGAPFFKIHDRVTILWSDGELEEIDVAWATAADIRVLFIPWIPI